MYRSFVCVIICIALIFSTVSVSFASSDVTFPSPQPVYIDQGGYTIATVNSTGGVSFSTTSFVGAITNLCQSLGSIISYYKTSDITVSQANNTPRQTNFKGAIFDISMILSGIYADSSSIRNFINQANTTLALIDNKLDSLYSITSSTNNYVYRIHDNTNTIEQELMDIHSEHGDILQSIYDTLYFNQVKLKYNYNEEYYNNTSLGSGDKSQYINQYPYDDNVYYYSYFQPVVDTQYIKNQTLIIHYPYNTYIDILPYVKTVGLGAMVFDNPQSMSYESSAYTVNVYNDNANNEYIVTYSFKKNITTKYAIITLLNRTNVYNGEFDGCVPYILGEEEVKKSYFELWRELYASDDIINSKEQQKPLEEAILGEFTGDGTASISIGDATNMAEISSDIKNGFNAGGSIGGLMSVFNSNDATLFSWFTQTVSDEINTIYNPTRSNNNIINFIDKQYEFINNNFN